MQLPDADPFEPGAPLPDGPLAILDWGIRALDRPALLVDHVMPEVAPRDDQVFLSGYGELPVVPSAALLRRVHPGGARSGSRRSGSRRRSGPSTCRTTSASSPRSSMRRGASRRSGSRALELLARHDVVVDALADPRVAELDDGAPRLEGGAGAGDPHRARAGGDVAIVRFESDYVLEDVVARSWALRLPAYKVVAVRNGTEVAGWRGWPPSGSRACSDAHLLRGES